MPHAMKKRERELASSSCVAEVMGTDLFTVTPDTGVAAALRLAATKSVRHFLVIDDGSLTGIVCDTDLHRAPRGTVVSDCMSTPVLCISPETTLEEAVGIMEENAVGCLPVVTGSFLVGLITKEELHDLTEDDEEEEEGEDARLCVACGSERRVVRDVRTNLIPLCLSCLSGAQLDLKPSAN